MAVVKPPEFPPEDDSRLEATKFISDYNRELRGANQVKDHEGYQIKLIWHPKERYKQWGTIPPFPFQVYLTKNAKQCVEDPVFQEKFAAYIDNLLGKYTDCQYHLEIYHRSLANGLDCVAHQRKEVEWRYRNAIWPQIIRRWSTDERTGYIGKILVIDTDDWEKDGIDFVSFDPVEYEHPEKFHKWRYAGVGDISTVRSCRLGVESHVERWLGLWWSGAGLKWTEADLERRNNGGYSPAIYPAVDPESYRDVEDDDAVQDVGTTLSTLAVEEENEDDGPPLIRDAFNTTQLFQHGADFPNYRTEWYNEVLGLHVASVWDRTLSKLRPPYSFTLYLSHDSPLFQPRAVFSALNRGFLAAEAWTLDIVYKMPSIEGAFECHSRSSAKRTPAKTVSRRRYNTMIIRKIAEKRLPDELQEYIVDLLSPPAVPDYSARRSRPFSSFFMYLDAKSLSMGPQLVYSKPRSFWNNNTPTELMDLLPSDTSLDWPSMCADEKLQIRNLRSWHRVCDELHIIWSMSSPPTPLPNGTPLPHMKFKLTVPEVWTPSIFKDFENPKVLISADLQSANPIIIHQMQPFSHHCCGDAHEIVDLETGEVLPQLPYRAFGINSCFDSWSQGPGLGLTGTRDNLMNEALLCIRSPGPSNETFLGTSDWWWRETVDVLCKLGSWVDGRQYALRLKEGVTIPRWLFDSSDHVTTGPYNYPRIPVNMDEIRFTWRNDDSNNTT